LNFEKNADLKLLFKENLDPRKIIDEIGFYIGRKIEPFHTLLFFDEIQACEEAITALKYFYEEIPEYHIISAGSLLGVAVGKERSFPVGKVNFLTMYPMSFHEFLLAYDEEMLINRLLNQRKIEKLPELIHEKLIYHLKLYLFIGGMPEVLQDYLTNKNVESVRNIQKEILKAYERDFSKYASNTQAIKTIELWKSIPFQLSRENKKFKYGDVRKRARASDFEQTIEWLRQAGLINIAYHLNAAKLPMAGYIDRTKFKVYLLDTGLLGAMLDISSKIIVNPSKLFNEYNGAFIENFVAMGLKSSGMEELYYWTSSGEAEVDFVIQHDNSIYPIEVKSGKSRNLKSLRSYQSKNNPQLLFRLSPRNFYKDNEFINLPLYSAFILSQSIDIAKN
jgi:hypothetical protein